jgi:ATP synthase protein I
MWPGDWARSPRQSEAHQPGREPVIDADVKQMWRAALRFSALGLEMGICVGLGYGAGWWLDRRFGTQPYLMLLMILLGIAAAFRGLIRAARQAVKDSKADNGDQE